MIGDVAIIGAGIAGASLACELAGGASVLLLEAEAFAGYHTTGRSAALFNECYGNAVIRALTAAARDFFITPPAGFAATALLMPRGCLIIARADQQASLEAQFRAAPQIVPIDAAEARRRVPVLRPDAVAAAGYDAAAMDIDVHALHQGFLRGAKAQGARLVTDARVTAIERRAGRWHLTTEAGTVQARILVNAAGAWAGEIGRMAGATPIGLTPLRRTALLIDPPPGSDSGGWPMVLDADEEFYFKPDAGRLLVSPADETPSPPCDAQPEELDIALAIDRLQRAADLPVRRIFRSWAGLRSFVADRSPVVGWDTGIEGLFWLAGQGGYGIQTAPALARLAASLCRGEAVPADLAARGLSEAVLSPGRLLNSPPTRGPASPAASMLPE
ncbi:MAG: D-arginine dehydrogenase [Aliidongia sp.]|nr:D-arginine dehydrogenase [Aliidongia sp.]